jgi:hypothetical protein
MKKKRTFFIHHRVSNERKGGNGKTLFSAIKRRKEIKSG